MATVTLIDADAAAVSPVQAALEQRGHTCVVLHDGAQAIDSLRHAPPRAIVLSVEMPQVSGYSLCNKIKRDPVLQAIPLLLVSSQATAETFEEHKRLRTRADAYGHKPYDVEATVATLSPWLGDTDEHASSVEHTEQARLSTLQNPKAPSAVRFGEDPSVRDISSSPFLGSDPSLAENPEHRGETPVDFAANTQVLSQEDLGEEVEASRAPEDAGASGFAEEQAWVEQALMGLSQEPTRAKEVEGGEQPNPTDSELSAPLIEEPAQAAPEETGGGQANALEHAPLPGSGDALDPSFLHNEPDIFSRPTAAMDPVQSEGPDALEEARATEVDPPKRRRSTRGGDKKAARRPSGKKKAAAEDDAPVHGAETSRDAHLEDDVTLAAQELSRLARALDEALLAKEELEKRIAQIAQRIRPSVTHDDQAT